MNTPDIFKFDSYFEYFKEIYELNKLENPNFSYQVFANKLKISKSLLYDMLNNKKKISIKHSYAFIKLLNLSDIESEYLIYLFIENNCDSNAQLYFSKERKRRFNTNVSVSQEAKSDIEDPKFYLYQSILRILKRIPTHIEVNEIYKDICYFTEEELEHFKHHLVDNSVIQIKDGQRIEFNKSNSYVVCNIDNFHEFSGHFDRCSQNFIRKLQKSKKEEKDNLSPYVYDHLYVNLTRQQAKELDQEILFLRNKYADLNFKPQDKLKVYQFDIRLFPCSDYID